MAGCDSYRCCTEFNYNALPLRFASSKRGGIIASIRYMSIARKAVVYSESRKFYVLVLTIRYTCPYPRHRSAGSKELVTDPLNKTIGVEERKLQAAEVVTERLLGAAQ